ncbi:MAG: hypothetical protein ACOZQL_24730 [Myxococcota bacterium]
MFGTAASNAAPPAPQPPPPAAKQTMVFGQSPASPANQTMMFGTPASNAAAQPPAAPVAPAAKTMVFGNTPAAPSKNQTMMFGTPASNPAPDEPGEETILEPPGSVPPAASPKNQTMMFGRAAPIPKVTAGTVELAGYAADENAPNESTVRVDVQQVIDEHESAPESGEPPRHDRTQRYAMSEVGAGPTPPEGSSAVQDRHNRTQLFAMTVQEPTVPVSPALSSNVVVEDQRFDLNSTLPPDSNVLDVRIDQAATLPPDSPVLPLERRRDPDGVSVLQDPANYTPPEAPGAPVLPSALATTLPNLGPVNEARPMPPLSLEISHHSPAAVPSPPVLAQDDAAALRAARSGGAGRIVVIVLALIALVLLGVLVYRLFGPQLGLTGQSTPPAAVGGKAS